MRELFPTATVVVDVNSPPLSRWLTLEADEAAERTIRRLFTAVASWLLAETSTLEDQVEFWESVAGLAEEDAEQLQALLERAMTASGLLLEHAEAGRWRSLLARYLPASTPETTHASGRAPQHYLMDPAAGAGGMLSANLVWLLQQEQGRQQERKPLVVCTFSAGSGKTAGLAAVFAELAVEGSAERALKVVDHHAEAVAGWFSRRFIPVRPSSWWALDEPAARSQAGSADLLLWMRSAVREHQPDWLVFDPNDFRRRSMRVWFRRDALPGPDVSQLLANGLLPDLTGTKVMFTSDGHDRVAAYWRMVCRVGGASSIQVVPEQIARGARAAPTSTTSAAPPTQPRTSPMPSILSSWPSTLRAVAVTVVGAVALVATILALGYSDVSALVTAPAAAAGLIVVIGTGLRQRSRALRSARRETLFRVCSQTFTTRDPDDDVDLRTALLHTERTWLAPAAFPTTSASQAREASTKPG